MVEVQYMYSMHYTDEIRVNGMYNWYTDEGCPSRQGIASITPCITVTDKILHTN
jgi:hypothetical protein